ncbi:MAG: flagellar type III secretion system pore protein FliP [Planctomycetes bacterium]|nr:flagellar type III secretion system pore protein FliP [Planctomycetota bacterium]
MSRWLFWAIPAGLLAAAAPAVTAQQTPAVVTATTPTTAPASGAGPAASGSLPKLGQVIDAIEKASADQDAGPGGKRRDWSAPVKLAVVFAGLALLPSLLVMTTSFTRIVIVLAFIRRALTTQNIPPTIAIVGLALFLTIFTMSPTFALINQQALQPYLADKLTFEEACEKGNGLLKDFMLRQTRRSDLALFVELAGIETPKTAGDVPTYVAVPSFAVSEFRTAFEMGCLLFIPFLLIDLVVASILLSTGMMMLPPAIISLPFKVILFVLVDGWGMMARTLVKSFNY